MKTESNEIKKTIQVMKLKFNKEIELLKKSQIEIKLKMKNSESLTENS